MMSGATMTAETGKAIKAFRAAVRKLDLTIETIRNGFNDPRDATPAALKAYATLNRIEDRAYAAGILDACSSEVARLRAAIGAADEAGRAWARERREVRISELSAPPVRGGASEYEAEMRIDMARRGVRL